jgi:hypothetical protein
MALFDASGHCRTHADCSVSFHEVVICEIKRNRSFKVFNLFAESVRDEPSQTAAMHPQRVILLFNVGCCDRRRARHPIVGDKLYGGDEDLFSGWSKTG